MDVIINEFSIDEQFENVDVFFDSLLSVISIQKIMEICSMKLLKHQEIYDYKVTKDQNLYQILTDKNIRTTSELRKFKIFLKRLMYDPPFWQEDQKHNPVDVYVCDYTNKTSGHSLAEACERDKLVLSFINDKFSGNSIEVRKNGTPIYLTNITDPKFFADYLKEMGLLNIVDYCINRFVGTNISFSELDSSNSFDILEEEEINVFVSTFVKFSELSWKEIMNSDGLEFKKYQPASKKVDWFANTQYNHKQIYKFRASQRFRCFGYREGDIFYVLRFERNHKISDYG